MEREMTVALAQTGPVPGDDPSDGVTEGSYGEATTPPAPSERPASTAPCRAQSLGTCP